MLHNDSKEGQEGRNRRAAHFGDEQGPATTCACFQSFSFLTSVTIYTKQSEEQPNKIAPNLIWKKKKKTDRKMF